MKEKESQGSSYSAFSTLFIALVLIALVVLLWKLVIVFLAIFVIGALCCHSVKSLSAGEWSECLCVGAILMGITLIASVISALV